MNNLEFKNNDDFITLFEKRLSDFTSAPYVVLTDSCSNAIFLALKYFSSKVNFGEIITIPKNTYISVAQSIIHAGFTTEFVEIKWKETYELGNTNIMDCALGFKNNMYIQGKVMCLSFQQKKALNIGKGGAILLDNEEDYKILKRMTWDGRDSSKPVSNDVPILGYHMNMTPDDAARGVLLLNQLTDEIIISKLKSYNEYPDISVFNFK